jgi:hypothetical protein
VKEQQVIKQVNSAKELLTTMCENIGRMLGQMMKKSESFLLADTDL